MENRVAGFIDSHKLIEPGEVVLVGLSGGPDSVALLHLLLRLGGEKGFTVKAAHFNHCLRAEADSDQEFAAGLCRSMGIEFLSGRGDVEAEAGRLGMSREEAGRRLRYVFLEEAACRMGAGRIATAHHMQDQAETVLMHLIQGTGVRGLQGMAPRRGALIRPFLCVTRGEIEDYLRRFDLDCRIDRTNYDKNYLRNRIRLELIPLLEERFNPAVVEGLCRLGEVVREENVFWDQQMTAAWETCVRENEYLELELQPFLSLQPALRRRLLQAVLEKAGAARCGFKDVERVLELAARGEATGKRVPVTGGLRVERTYDSLAVGVPDPVSFACRLPVPGEVHVPEINLTVSARLAEGENDPTAGSAFFDWERVQEPLIVRSRRPGDRFEPDGFQGSKKLQDFFVDARVPRFMRGRIPLLTAGNGIMWVMGFRRDRRFVVTPETRRVLEIRVGHSSPLRLV